MSAILYTILIYLIISIVWVGIEKMVYGKITPKRSHDLIAIVLSIALYNILF